MNKRLRKKKESRAAARQSGEGFRIDYKRLAEGILKPADPRARNDTSEERDPNRGG